MNIDNLVEMANDIGNYFNSEPDKEEAINGIFLHIQRFWEDRMHKQILAYQEKGGEGLSPLVSEALIRLKSHIEEPG